MCTRARSTSATEARVRSDRRANLVWSEDIMFRILVDTCVWLDLAKDAKQTAVLGVVEELVRRNELALIVPRIVLDEFKRNRDRIAKESAKSLNSHFRIVREAVAKVGGNKRKLKAIIAHLDDIDHKIPLVGGQAVARLDRIEKLLAGSTIVEATEATKLRAAERAIAKKAPFHRNTNAMADATLIEIYSESVRDKAMSGVRFAFVTHNKNDFSVEQSNQKMPHADLADLFSKIKSRYFINLAEVLRLVDASLVTQTMIEESWTQDPRNLSEILEAEEKLFNQVWYNRHWNRRVKIKRGEIRIVEAESESAKPSSGEKTIQRVVWEGAMRAAKEVEKRYGKEELGPWDDFEWGMVNGKLSALRWALGDEWDMLDT